MKELDFCPICGNKEVTMLGYIGGNAAVHCGRCGFGSVLLTANGIEDFKKLCNANRGEWIELDHGVWKCSVCNHRTIFAYLNNKNSELLQNFCTNCGADMRP